MQRSCANVNSLYKQKCITNSGALLLIIYSVLNPPPPPKIPDILLLHLFIATTMIITVGPRDFLRVFFSIHTTLKKKDYINTTKLKAHFAFFFSSSGWQRGLVLDHPRLGRHRLDHRRRGCRRA